MTDVCAPVGHRGYLSARRALIMLLFGLSIVIAVFCYSAVRAETQNCNAMLWRFVVYNSTPEFYTRKCGCPNNLDYRFPCNSQYIPAML